MREKRFISDIKRDCELNLMWLSMQRWQWLIYNGILKTLFWSKMWEIPSFVFLEKCRFLWGSSLLPKNKKCASHFRRETANKETTTLIYNLIVWLTWSDKTFQGTVVNWALLSLPGESLEITLSFAFKAKPFPILLFSHLN